MTKATILIIHGGWHTPSSYAKLISALESADYEVYAPTLPSMNGARPPTANLAADTALVRSYTENLLDTGKNLTVLMHSYGGQVGTNALVGLGVETRRKQGKAGGVEKLVYVSAFAMVEGKAMIDKVREMGHEELMPLAFDFADDKTCLPRDPNYLIGETPGLDEQEVREYGEKMVSVRWNGDCMYQGIERCAWREIPVAYVYCRKDTCVPLDYQKSVVEGLYSEGVEAQVEELDTGHCPHLTATKGLVDIVGRLVGALK